MLPVLMSALKKQHEAIPENKGGWTALIDHGETIGAVLRTRIGVKPLYVSSGHKTCLESTIKYVLACIKRYKLPETTRCGTPASLRTSALNQAR